MSVTHTSTHKRANDYRGRHGMSVSLNVDASRIRGRATRMKGSVEKEHRIVKPTRLRPSHQAYRRPRSENPRPLRHCGLRLTLAARRRRSRRARQTLDMGWFGWASRPLLRPLLGARRTSWQATMGGTAYRDHRKAAGRAADARRQRVGREADPGYVYCIHNRGRKGLTDAPSRVGTHL